MLSPEQYRTWILPELLKEAGYHTMMVGKWHCAGVPFERGFDRHFGFMRGGTNYFLGDDSFTLDGKPWDVPKEDFYVTTALTEYAVRFLREECSKHSDEPFFLYLALTIPHANNEAGKKGMEVPCLGDYADLDWPEPQKGHAAMITRLDRDVGRLLAKLKELDLDQKTIVFFTSDNGGVSKFWKGGMSGNKSSAYEGGVRVDAFARWPGMIEADSTVSDIVHVTDLFTTFARVAGAEGFIPRDRLIDGVDPLLTRTLFWFSGHPIVYFWLLPVYVSWYMMLPKWVGGKLYSDGLTRMVFISFLLLIPVGVQTTSFSLMR